MTTDAIDAARYRKLRPYLEVATSTDETPTGEVQHRLAFTMTLELWGPPNAAPTVDAMLDRAAEPPHTDS